MSARARLVPAVVLLAACAAAGPAVAQNKTGTSLGQFLQIEPGARIAAMGNAGATLGDGLQAVYFNPAAIGLLETFDVDFTHAEWFAGIAYDHIAAGMPLGKWGRGYTSITSLNSGEIDVRTVDQPLGTGERYTVSDLALALGWGFEVTDRVAAGVQVNVLQERIWHSTASTFTFNIGTLYRAAPNGLRIGASLTNFGTDASFTGRDLAITYDNDPNRTGDNGTLPGDRSTGDYPVPMMFRLGASMPYRFGNDWKALVACDAAHPSDDSESLSLGGELQYRNLVALRGGYQNLFLEDAEMGLTLGAGFRGRLESVNYRLDYGWADQGRLEGTHRITLGVTFQ